MIDRLITSIISFNRAIHPRVNITALSLGYTLKIPGMIEIKIPEAYFGVSLS